ncbi:MAG: hypothetical protein ACO1OB_17000 [Archangium sp.]
MIRVAILGSQLLGQLANEDLGSEVEVVWKGTSSTAFRLEVPPLQPDVVVIDLVDLAGAVDQEVRALFGLVEFELGIVTYSFARRQLLRDLKAPNVRVLQGPMGLDTLRAHLMPLVVKSVLESGRRPAVGAPATEVMARPAPESPPARNPEFRFSRVQLGKLLTIKSEIACECPNHVAQLVEALQQFELYSKGCENRDEDDRAMHQRQATVTGRARTLMEEVLVELLAHEKISV